jgi:hypothetical protein
MPSTKVIVGVIVVVLVCLSSIMAYVSTRPKPPPINVEPSYPTPAKPKRPKRTPSPATTAPTAAPTTAPTTAPMVSSNQTIVYADPYVGIMAPPPPPTILVPAMHSVPTFVMVPGANMPGMVGRRRDEVTTYIMTRYPRLVVRAMPVGSPVTYDVRKDRITVSYDPYTNRVVTARVG